MSNTIGWDAAAFLNEYSKYAGNWDLYYLIKRLRTVEYDNTVAIARQGYYVNRRGETVSLNYANAGEAFFYRDEIVNPAADYPKYGQMEIEVVDGDCLAVAMRMLADGYHPAVLNMANRQNPGGAVTSGAGAQEESIFRRTDLFRSLYRFAPYAPMYGVQKAAEQYPLDRNFGGIYTPCALIFRDCEERGYELLDAPVAMSFITVAGINRPALTPDNKIVPHLVEAVKNKVRTILRIGARHRHDSLVLSALGCGAFRNPPRHVAQIFHEVLQEEEFRIAFRKVVFAIFDDHNAHKAHNREGNFIAFKEEFCGNPC